MAGYYPASMQELDDVHRLLPREILKDLGIMEPGEQKLVDAIEDLAAHLASVLGGTPKKTSRHHHPQVNVGRGLVGGADVLAGGANARRVAVPPPFLPVAPAAPWLVMESLRRNNMVLHPMATMPGLAAPGRPVHRRTQPTTMQGGVGTGVFLPRTEVVVPHMTARPPPSNGKQARFAHRRGREAVAAAVVRTQQGMHVMAAQMDQRYLAGVHARRELALPQEWTY